MKSKTIILLVLALGCGLVASIGISQVLRNQQAAPVEETGPIMVAMADIKAGESLSALNLKVEQWPKEKIPPGALTKLEDVDGKKVRAAVYQGEPVLDKKLAGNEEMPSSSIPKGYRLYTLQADGMSSHGGLLHPGDRVDVMLFINKGNTMMDAGTNTILQDIQVFAVNDVVRSPDVKGAEAITAKTVTLLLKPVDAEKAALAGQIGKLTLSMRAPDDEDTVPGSGTTLMQLMTVGKNDRNDENMDRPVNPNIKQASLAATLSQYEQVASTPATQAAPAEDGTFKVQLIKGTELSVAEFHKSDEDPSRWSNGSYTVILPADSKQEAIVAPSTQPGAEVAPKSATGASDTKTDSKNTKNPAPGEGPQPNPPARG